MASAALTPSAFAVPVDALQLPFRSSRSRAIGLTSRTGATGTRCSLQADELAAKEIVYLGSQRIGDAGAAVVGQALAKPGCRIRMVNLDGNNLGCEGATALAYGIRNNQTLEELVLYDNDIACRGMSALASAIAESVCPIRVLSMPSNRVGPDGGEALGRLLGTNTSLETVYLMGQAKKGGGIKDYGAFGVASGLRENGGPLWFVNVSGNGISETGLNALREARIAGKHVVFPVDPYPGPNTMQSFS